MPGLLERLGRPTTFVVGKGGVGKTTTAGGLALALADRGIETHLLSTDPAHSIADLFGQNPGAGPVTSRCTDRLVLEELDAVTLVRRRFESLRPALREVIDEGTYLDPDDAESLLDGALPGLDEIGAALRIATLAAAGGRLVVDTAPTGHTLRMLDAEVTVRGWLAVFAAMAAKADTVASALVGRPVRLHAEAELQRLAADMEAFAKVLDRADFVVVTGPGVVVRAETERLVAALRARRLAVVAVAAVARPGAVADVLLPVRPALSGCAALREWWQAVPSDPAPSAPEAGEAAVAGPARRSADLAVLERGLVVFAGKGGVGKTTCASALAVRLAEVGPVAILGADPAGSLADVLGGPVPGLTVLEADAEAELEALKDRYREEVGQLFGAAGLNSATRMDQAIIESLWDAAPPGIDELMTVGRLADQVPPASRVILDTAPTGHFLRLLSMPELALDWTHRILRILLKYSAVGGLDATAGPLIRLARRFRALHERLSDPSRTAIVVVTLDEPLVLAETRRLLARLRRLELQPAAVIVNRSGPDPSSDVDGLPTFRAPAVREPVGAEALRAFAHSWERSS